MTDGATILLVDEHAIVREGYRLLQKQLRFKVVAEASDGAEAYRLFEQTRPDLVIMDLTMPGFNGVEAIRRVGNGIPPPTFWSSLCIRTPPTPCRRSGPGPRAMSRKAVSFDVLQGRIALSADIDHEVALSGVGDTPAVTDVLTSLDFAILRMLLARGGGR